MTQQKFFSTLRLNYFEEKMSSAVIIFRCCKNAELEISLRFFFEGLAESKASLALEAEHELKVDHARLSSVAKVQ